MDLPDNGVADQITLWFLLQQHGQIVEFLIVVGFVMFCLLFAFVYTLYRQESGHLFLPDSDH